MGFIFQGLTHYGPSILILADQKVCMLYSIYIAILEKLIDYDIGHL